MEKAARFTAKCAPAGRSAAAERAPERAAERAGPRATAAAGGGLAAGRSPAAVRSPAAAEGAAAGRPAAHPAAAAAGAAGAAADRSEAEVTEEVLKYRITQIAYQAELLQNDALRIFLRSKDDSRWSNCETDEELRGVLWSLNNSFEDAGISYEDELYTCTYAGTLRVFAAALGL